MATSAASSSFSRGGGSRQQQQQQSLAEEEVRARLDGLNEQQQRAVVADVHAPLLVIAGAGSGKTTTMVRRIEHIIEATRCAPKEVLAITFTRNAADEMRERLKKGCRTTARGKGVVILTIHSFCLRLLRSHLDKLYDEHYDGAFTVASKHEQMLIVEDALDEFDSSSGGGGGNRGKGGNHRRGSGGKGGGEMRTGASASTGAPSRGGDRGKRAAHSSQWGVGWEASEGGVTDEAGWEAGWYGADDQAADGTSGWKEARAARLAAQLVEEEEQWPCEKFAPRHRERSEAGATAAAVAAVVIECEAAPPAADAVILVGDEIGFKVCAGEVEDGGRTVGWGRNGGRLLASPCSQSLR